LVQTPIRSDGQNDQPLRLRIRPDGNTHLIPWAALPGTDGRQYWIENLQLQVCHGLPVRPRETDELPPPSLLVVGGVEFGLLSAKYPPLAGSATERHDVAERFQTRFQAGQVVGLSKRAAVRKAVVAAMPGKSYIHLATHGFFDRGNQDDVFGVTGVTTSLQTGLIVAEPVGGGGPHEQYLTAADIGELDLSDARLVMLSACESGLGSVRAGQGVEGLLGSFHAAGAAEVIGTLWVVGDEPTVILVNRFYHHLWTVGLSPAAALRAAQLDLVNGRAEGGDRQEWAHPYAWAAFVCSHR
jgi:CHAT domain-containing protein